MSRQEKEEYERIKRRLLGKNEQETVASRQYTSLYVQLTENDLPGAIHALNLLLYSVSLPNENNNSNKDKMLDGTTISVTEHQRQLDAVKEAADSQLEQLQELARKREQHILNYMNDVAEREHHRCKALKKKNKRLRTHLLVLEANAGEQQANEYANDSTSSGTS